MRINFFEEYPTEENLAKLDFVSWPATLFIATSTLKGFEDIRLKYCHKYPHITFGWWPIIPGSYWVSSFSNSVDLDKLFGDLTHKKHNKELLVLLDFELPINNFIYFRNLFKIKNNKKKINDFLANYKKYNLKIYSAEYPAIGKMSHKLWKTLGISPDISFGHTRISMCYSSIITGFIGNLLWNKIKKYESLLARNNPNQISFGLGVIDFGVFNNEKILTSEYLKDDILWAKKANVTEVFIFRLGGLKQDYLDLFK